MIFCSACFRKTGQDGLPQEHVIDDADSAKEILNFIPPAFPVSYNLLFFYPLSLQCYVTVLYIVTMQMLFLMLNKFVDLSEESMDRNLKLHM